MKLLVIVCIVINTILIMGCDPGVRTVVGEKGTSGSPGAPGTPGSVGHTGPAGQDGQNGHDGDSLTVVQLCASLNIVAFCIDNNLYKIDKSGYLTELPVGNYTVGKNKKKNKNKCSFQVLANCIVK